jgi:hypothetical protein
MSDIAALSSQAGAGRDGQRGQALTEWRAKVALNLHRMALQLAGVGGVPEREPAGGSYQGSGGDRA